jgi:hypothetical protein
MTTLRKTIVLGTIALLLAYSRAQALDSQLALTNAALVVTVNTSNATFSVLDRRTGRLWTQRAARRRSLSPKRARNPTRLTWGCALSRRVWS